MPVCANIVTKRNINGYQRWRLTRQLWFQCLSIVILSCDILVVNWIICVNSRYELYFTNVLYLLYFLLATSCFSFLFYLVDFCLSDCYLEEGILFTTRASVHVTAICFISCGYHSVLVDSIMCNYIVDTRAFVAALKTEYFKLTGSPPIWHLEELC